MNRALAGCAPALRLCADIAAEPTAPLRVAATGPGGSGKTALLEAIAARYRQAGVPVVRGVEQHDIPPDCAVLVDDAHLLTVGGLERLRGLAAGPTPRLIVACRPWPSSPQLSSVVTSLSRARPPVVLGHLDRPAVAARAAAILGHPVPDTLAELVLAHTGGLPVLVDRMVTAWADAGLDTGTVVALPNDVVEQFRADLGQLDHQVRDALLVFALDAELDIDALADVLGVDAAAAAETVDGVLATGWSTDDGVLVPMARQAILRLTPGVRVKAALHRLAGLHLSRRGSLLAAGCRLLDTGASGAGVAAVLEAAGDEAMAESSVLATRLFAAAAEAGAPAVRLAARRAEATALTGDLDSALRFADYAVAEPQAPDRTRGVLVAAAVLAHRGLLTRSAELYRWLETSASARTPAAVPTLIATGDLDRARSMLAAAATGQPPTLREGAELLMAQGIYETVTGSATVALSQLTRAAAMLEPSGRTVLLPDTPAALAAVVALHCGELEIADSVLGRALEAELGGAPAAPRHRLLRAWTAMRRGNLAYARTLLDGAVPRGERLEPRDELVAAALEIGVARRGGAAVGESEMWSRAREAVLRYPVDLYTLQPLGELAVAAARSPERAWLAPYLEQAHELVDRLGRPVLWAAPMDWFGVQAAIAAEAPPAAKRHAAALATAAEQSPYAATLAAAAQCWLKMLGGEIDAESVASVARRLDAAGLGWDGARLAAQAAIRTTDRAAMSMLLGCARSVNAVVPPSPQPPAAQPEWPDAGQGVLSPREVEVARLVLAGFTYKQAGERLFITAKTVEHHVARMRGRLGCASRGELLDRLRGLLVQQDGQ